MGRRRVIRNGWFVFSLRSLRLCVRHKIGSTSDAGVRWRKLLTIRVMGGDFELITNAHPANHIAGDSAADPGLFDCAIEESSGAEKFGGAGWADRGVVEAGPGERQV